MEITKEFREAAFMAYPGCPAISIRGVGSKVSKHFLYFYELDRFKLQLKGLPSISDEDKMQVAHLCGHYPMHCAVTFDGYIFSFLYDNSASFIEVKYLSGDVYDYLRSKGYNLPFRGVNLVEAGIAELITNDKNEAI